MVWEGESREAPPIPILLLLIIIVLPCDVWLNSSVKEEHYGDNK